MGRCIGGYLILVISKRIPDSAAEFWRMISLVMVRPSPLGWLAMMTYGVNSGTLQHCVLVDCFAKTLLKVSIDKNEDMLHMIATYVCTLPRTYETWIYGIDELI